MKLRRIADEEGARFYQGGRRHHPKLLHGYPEPMLDKKGKLTRGSGYPEPMLVFWGLHAVYHSYLL